MAKRRMFSLDIIDTDLFMEMPQSSRLLYYELCMRADDDGFVSSPKKIMKMVGCNEDDFRVLTTKQFIIPFDTGIVVIKHWKIHNYIQKDRYKETIYLDEKSKLNQEKNGMYTKCIQDGYTGKDRLELGKARLGENSQDNHADDLYDFVEKNNLLGQMSDKRPPEIELEIEKDKEKEKYDNKIFEKFWNEYPKKISKGNAEKWFKKNKPTNDLVELMIEKLKIYKETEQWKKDNGKYIPYPSSWLNAKGWEDEIQSNNIKRKYDTSIVYHDKYIGDYKLDENGRRIFV